jgi:hypothetical protein
MSISAIAEEICDAELGDHIVDIGAGDGDAIVGAQRGPNPRFEAIVRRRCEADDGFAALRARGAAQELALRRDAAVELARELVDAHLPGQVQRKDLRHRNHLVLGRDRCRIAHDIDRLEGEQRIAIDHVVQPIAADCEAGDDLAALARLALPGEDAFLQQRDHRVGDHIRVDAEILAVRQVLEGGIGDATKADLQR